MKSITPHLWLDTQAVEAVNFYVSVFPNSKITHQSVIKNTPSGDCDMLSFELNGQPYMAISAGPIFKFNEAISFVIPCEDQKEIDYYWEKLSADPKAEQCGWCKDKFGLSWQVVPARLAELIKHPRAMEAMLQMKKLDIAQLERAAAQ